MFIQVLEYGRWAVALDDTQNPTLLHSRLCARAKFRHGCLPLFFELKGLRHRGNSDDYMPSDGYDRSLGREPLGRENFGMRFAQARRYIIRKSLRFGKSGGLEYAVGYRKSTDQVRDRHGSR